VALDPWGERDVGGRWRWRLGEREVGGNAEIGIRVRSMWAVGGDAVGSKIFDPAQICRMMLFDRAGRWMEVTWIAGSALVG
jgi:hypothetical protein